MARSRQAAQLLLLDVNVWTCFWKVEKTLTRKRVIVKGFGILVFTAKSESVRHTLVAFLEAWLLQKWRPDDTYRHRHWWFCDNSAKTSIFIIFYFLWKINGKFYKTTIFWPFLIILTIYGLPLSGLFFWRMWKTSQKCTQVEYVKMS